MAALDRANDLHRLGLPREGSAPSDLLLRCRHRRSGIRERVASVLSPCAFRRHRHRPWDIRHLGCAVPPRRVRRIEHLAGTVLRPSHRRIRLVRVGVEHPAGAPRSVAMAALRATSLETRPASARGKDFLDVQGRAPRRRGDLLRPAPHPWIIAPVHDAVAGTICVSPWKWSSPITASRRERHRFRGGVV